jgi:transcriptional regulator with XRE-family HTH domain
MRTIRKARGWTAAQLGDALTKRGIRWDRFTVASLENGKRQSISVKELFVLAQVLGIDPWTLTADPRCAACDDVPPRGFTCDECGTRGEVVAR